MSVLLANNGCDIVSPSDMMDGRVKIIRSELEKSKNKHLHNVLQREICLKFLFFEMH